MPNFKKNELRNMKNKMVLSFVLISFIVLKCVSISHLYKGPIGFGMIMIANSIRLESFEKNIACYYYNYREFRFNEVPLDNIDKELIFSTLQKQYSSDQMVKYNFEMKPYTFTSTSDSSESEVDSINILKFIGVLLLVIH